MSTLNRRELLDHSTRLAAAATILYSGMAAATPGVFASEFDVMQLVHPELRSAARQVRDLAATFPPPSDAALPQLRQMTSSPPPSPAISYERRTIAGARGAPDIGIYVINARAGTNRPGILHMHGGGYIMGSAASGISELQKIAAELDCCITTTEYRLAPETRYVDSVEDNYAGLLWLHANARELGVDRMRIALMGESAGGGHAALLAIAARDRGQVPLAFQCLTYPMLDDRTGSSSVVPAHLGTLLWTAALNRYGWRAFLGMNPGGADVPAAAVPARTADLAGLPPTWIGVGALDLFVGEDISYARRLIDVGVPTELHVVPGAFHGFDVIAPTTNLAKRFSNTKVAALKQALSGSG